MAHHNDHNYRALCKHNELYMQNILDNLFRLLNVHTERIYDCDRQTRGADIAFHNGNEVMYLDEKMSVSHQSYVANGRSSRELVKETSDGYGMELSYKNRKNELTPGWFHPTERNKAINSGYIIGWLNTEKETRDCPDYGRLRKVNQIEICIVPYDKLREVVDQALGNKSLDEKIAEIYADIESHNAWHKHRVYGSELSDKGVRFSYSGTIQGQPLNCIIPKEILRDLSFVNYVFNMTGERGQERPVEFRNLKDDNETKTFRPLKELYLDTNKNPIGFPRPRYKDLEEKKARIMNNMGLPAKAFAMFVNPVQICEGALVFLKYSENEEKALRKMMNFYVTETGMANSKYYPLLMDTTVEKSNEMTVNDKRDKLVDAILRDHDKLSELYTIKALEEMRYEPKMILRATSKILPNNILGLYERINKCADYIEQQQQRGIKGYKPKSVDDKPRREMYRFREGNPDRSTTRH